MSDIFVKSHLAITRDLSEVHNALHPSVLPPTPELNILEVLPTYEDFAPLVEKVGGPYSWTRRPRYHGNNRTDMEEVLDDPSTRLFLLRKDEETLGYCLVTKREDEPQVIESLRARGLSTNMIEIENFGFFPEHTGKKYGQYFLPALFTTLFQEHETVYLSTRDTNHARVIPFYEKLGMQVIKQETLPNDLLPAAPEKRIKSTLPPPPASAVTHAIPSAVATPLPFFRPRYGT